MFFTGAITTHYTISGILFQKAPTFFSAAVVPGAVTLVGSLFSVSPIFYVGDIEGGVIIAKVVISKRGEFQSKSTKGGDYQTVTRKRGSYRPLS